MNKRAQSIFVLLMIAVVYFVIGLALAPATDEVVQDSFDSALLNCSNSSISDQNKAVCTSIDIMSPVFFWTVFGLAGIILGGIMIR